MKYAAYGLLAAFLALGVYGAIPTTAEGWYTPDTFAVVDRSADVVFYDEYGEPSWFSVTVDETGKILYGNSDFDTLGVIYPAYAAMIRALTAEALALRNKERIETIGKNLHNLGLADGIDIVGTDPNGNEHRYTMHFTQGSGIRDSLDDGSRPELTDPTAGWNMADEKTLHWRTNNKMELMGADTATSSTDEWWNDYGFFVPFLKGTGALGWKKYGGWYDGVFGTMTSDGRTMLTLAGWTGGHECSTDMNSILTEESGDNRANHYVLTRYGTGSDAVFHYVPFGDRLETRGGAPVDGVSITTNKSEGALSQGDASLYGWADADAESIPQKGDGHLRWTDPADMVDGISIGMTEAKGGGKVWEVKDSHVYAGKHANHYFGTSKQDDATLGWHELPNVTTNAVSGDEVTISSTVKNNEKLFGLKGWPSGGRDPLYLANVGGTLTYLPLYFPTNGAACGCTNKWESLASWIPDTSHDGDHFTPPESDISAYLKSKGFVYGDEGTDLNFSGGEASFDAPANWADDVTLTVRDGKFTLKNFADGACSANLNDMLTNTTANCEDRGNHQILCRYTKGGNTLHWLPFPNDPLKTGGEGDGWTGSFSYRNGRIQDGCVMIGRTPVRVSGMAATDGEYRITVDIAAKTATLGTGSGFSAPQGTISYIPVFVLSDGQITADYRGSFVVQAWE